MHRYFVSSSIFRYQELINVLVMILQALFIIGLRVTGQQLSDPYGADLVDLQIMRYVEIILNGSNSILDAKEWAPPTFEEEMRCSNICVSKQSLPLYTANVQKARPSELFLDNPDIKV